MLWRVSCVASVCRFLMAESYRCEGRWLQAALSSSRSRLLSSDSSDTVILLPQETLTPTAQHFSVCLQGDFLIKVHSDCEWEPCLWWGRPLCPGALGVTFLERGRWVGPL